VLRMYIVAETAQVELKSGRVQALAAYTSAVCPANTAMVSPV